ncbi:MAG: hypothetical protein ACLGI6_06250 [Gammaproteobacteria bacterium]
MAGKFLRGAFVQFMETMIIPLPNIIIFQFNPEQITHSWTPAESSGGEEGNPLAVSGAPGESFSFTLAMDSSDMIADGSPVAEGIATVSGIYTRLAALEMLMHPTGGAGGGLLGSVSLSAGGLSAGGALGGAAGGVERPVPASQLPTVLFVWGPGRILPVKVTSLTITETLYDAALLHPTHAEAAIGLQVLTPRELQEVNGPLAEVANIAYAYSQGLREVLAIANLANAAESAIGMLPL